MKIVPALLALFPGFLGPPLSSQALPGRGISQVLARRRKALLSEVRYGLSFRLAPGMTRVRGRVRIDFVLARPVSSLVLDFQGSDLREVLLQGVPRGKFARREDHILLPGALLRRGRNTFSASFVSPVASTGTPLTVYRDKAEGKEYFYTLLVPADAHRLFPCFDQPDLKARFSLVLRAPREWKCLSNSPEEGPPRPAGGGMEVHRFLETPPLSTYLFAFAAGPFRVLAGPSPRKGLPPIRVFFRPSRASRLEAHLLFRRHLECLRLYEGLFGVPYPFGKLDFVLLPGFPYGGMEHAGAIFYREASLCFDHPPTSRELVKRSTVIYHEVSHQWFGNLVTMKWFDDLWLKEGFANLMSYYALARLQPASRAWTRFHQDLTRRALRADVTKGTAPVYRPLGNLDDAKSNYGPIVYDKAPAVLKALLFRTGEKRFFRGLHLFLSRFAWKNASYRDLLACLEAAGAGDLSRWSAWWLLTPGLPEVKPRLWRDGKGGVLSLALLQESPQGWWEGGWPLEVRVLLGYPGGRKLFLPCTLEGPVGRVEGARGLPLPSWILPNPANRAYGLFLPWREGAPALMEDLPREEDTLFRSCGFASLEALARRGELDPGRFLEFCLHLLETERDPSSYTVVLGAAAAVLERFLSPRRRPAWRSRWAAFARVQLVRESRKALALPLVRFLLRTGGDLGLARMLVAGEAPLPWLSPGKKELFLAAAALVAAGRWKKSDLERFAGSFGREDTAKYAFLAGAASSDPRVKEAYFRLYLDPKGPPEQWVLESLSWFHWPGQEKVTLPFLERSLEKLGWIKAHRKIFFMPAWIDAFLGGHSSPGALETVRRFLREHPGLPGDIRLKILQSLDGLERAVMVQRKWG